MPVSWNDQLRLAWLSSLAAEDAATEQFVRTLREYATGKHPVYLTDRQKEFIGLNAKDADHLFAHNLCRLVIDAAVERLERSGFELIKGRDDDGEEVDDAASKLLVEMASTWWEANRMDATQDDLYEAACRDGEAYLIVDTDQDGVPRWTLNEKFDGTQGVKMHRDPDTNRILFASKRWQTWNPLKPKATGKTRLTLYFDNQVEKYISSTEAGNQAGWAHIVDAPDEPWPILWVDERGEPLGNAVIPFENPGGSEIGDLISIQDMLNKSDLDLIAAADTAGFRILWASGVTSNIDPSTGNEKEIDISPAKLIRLSQPESKLGAIDPVDLERMIRGSKYWIESAAGITRTPQYLFQAHGADQPSGESLKMQEVGLIQKVRRKQRVFGNAWEDVVTLSAKLWNLTHPGKAVPADASLQTKWRHIETRNEKEQAEIAKIMAGLGIPLETILADVFDKDQQQIAQIMALKEAEREAEGTLGENLLRAFERGGQSQ